jgi:predicted phosphatase
MPITTRTFRVFVSSTFEDLKDERGEAALDQKMMDICLREIEGCQRTGIKPNFIVLLGDRYGWRQLMKVRACA